EDGLTIREPRVDLAAWAGTVEAKPRLRGWSHALAAVGAIAATVALCSRCGDDPPRVASMLVYGLSMGWMFAVSATYHLGTWRPARHRAWPRRSLGRRSAPSSPAARCILSVRSCTCAAGRTHYRGCLASTRSFTS